MARTGKHFARRITERWKVLRVGAAGSAQATRAIVDYRRGAKLLAMSEALRIGERLGFAPDFVLRMSEELQADVHDVVRQEVVTRRFHSGTSLGIIRSNVDLAGKLAAALQISTPLLEATRVAWREAEEMLGSGADHTAIIRWLEGLRSPTEPASEREDDGAATG